MANEAQARGSEKLLAQLAKKGGAATLEEVKAAVSLPATSDFKFLRWLIRGIPPVYFDGIPKPDIAQVNVVLAHGGEV